MAVTDQTRMTEAGAALANMLAYMERVADKTDPHYKNSLVMANLAFETLVPNKELRKTLVDRVEEILRQKDTSPMHTNETPAA